MARAETVYTRERRLHFLARVRAIMTLELAVTSGCLRTHVQGPEKQARGRRRAEKCRERAVAMRDGRVWIVLAIERKKEQPWMTRMRWEIKVRREVMCVNRCGKLCNKRVHGYGDFGVIVLRMFLVDNVNTSVVTVGLNLGFIVRYESDR